MRSGLSGCRGVLFPSHGNPIRKSVVRTVVLCGHVPRVRLVGVLSWAHSPASRALKRDVVLVHSRRAFARQPCLESATRRQASGQQGVVAREGQGGRQEGRANAQGQPQPLHAEDLGVSALCGPVCNLTEPVGTTCRIVSCCSSTTIRSTTSCRTFCLISYSGF